MSRKEILGLVLVSVVTFFVTSVYAKPRPRQARNMPVCYTTASVKVTTSGTNFILQVSPICNPSYPSHQCAFSILKVLGMYTPEGWVVVDYECDNYSFECGESKNIDSTFSMLNYPPETYQLAVGLYSAYCSDNGTLLAYDSSIKTF